MSQSKKITHIKVLLNQIVGIVIGWCIIYFLFPFFEHLDQEIIATISSCLFFVSSYTRSYIIDRAFIRFGFAIEKVVNKVGSMLQFKIKIRR